MSSVLYDEPGPVARRRERIGSVIGGLLIVVLLALAFRYADQRGLFGADRWDVLYDPPKNQTAEAVWTSMVVKGLGATLRAAVVAAPLALLLGLLLAVWRTTRVRWLRAPATVVIELFRGLPVLLMMLFALLGFGWDAFAAVVFGLVVYNMAIIAEILRAGLASLPRGQAEAAYAIGLSDPAARAAPPGRPHHAAEPDRAARRPAQGLVARVHRRLPRAAQGHAEQRAVLRQQVLRGAVPHGRGDLPGRQHLADPARRVVAGAQHPDVRAGRSGRDGGARGAGRGRRVRRRRRGRRARLTGRAGQPAVALARTSRTTVTVISPG
jgi:His/Glu/Gln/Arg/opine family amino acid ABC transporter permease subunit